MDTHSNTPQKPEVIFARENGWMPRIVRKDDVLQVELVGGANSNHDPRVFYFPITEAHLEVIKNDVKRHFMLWSALSPLCNAAGTQGPLNEAAAVALLDPILLGSESEVENFLTETPWDKRLLIAHYATIALLEEGKVFEALDSATMQSDWDLVWEYDASRDRARRGVTLSPLDEAILKYTGQYLHGATIPARKPDAVDPELLPQVLEIIASAEQASTGMELRPNWGKGDYNPDDKKEWNEIQNKVDVSLKTDFPDLSEDSVKTVSFLMCSEAATRARTA